MDKIHVVYSNGYYATKNEKRYDMDKVFKLIEKSNFISKIYKGKDCIIYFKNNIIYFENYKKMYHDERLKKIFNNNKMKLYRNKVLQFKFLKSQLYILLSLSLITTSYNPSDYKLSSTISAKTMDDDNDIKISRIIDNNLSTTFQSNSIKKQENIFFQKIEEYAKMYFLDEDTSRNAIINNIEEELHNYPTIDAFMLETLYWVHKTVDDGIVLNENFDHFMIEEKIFRFAELYGIRDVNVLEVLIAIFRLESGWGKSDLSVNKNNFGGHLVVVDGVGVFNSYKTTEIGSAAVVRVVYSNLYNKNYDPNKTVLENLNQSYCTEEDWPEKVASCIPGVRADYADYFASLENSKQR